MAKNIGIRSVLNTLSETKICNFNSQTRPVSKGVSSPSTTTYQARRLHVILVLVSPSQVPRHGVRREGLSLRPVARHCLLPARSLGKGTGRVQD